MEEEIRLCGGVYLDKVGFRVVRRVVGGGSVSRGKDAGDMYAVRVGLLWFRAWWEERRVGGVCEEMGGD